MEKVTLFARFAVHLLMMSPSVEPTTYHVTFPDDPSNAAIVLVIASDTNSKPYYQYDEVPILDEGQTSIDIPRHALPHGGYHLTAMLMRWQDNGMEVAVDSADIIIVVP